MFSKLDMNASEVTISNLVRDLNTKAWQAFPIRVIVVDDSSTVVTPMPERGRH